MGSLISHTFDIQNKRLCEGNGFSIRNVFSHQGEIKVLGKNLPESHVCMSVNDERDAVTASDGVKCK